MLSSYFVLFIVSLMIAFFMYISNLQDTNKDLKRQKQNLQTKVIQEKVKSNVKEFQAKQKAKKEQIIKDTKKEGNEKEINLSVGSHTLSF